ncbi:BTAD domain-containing putative transcriptional regulator [Streptomyces sp. ML-6]|uniref:BTAD domain-containing putative transcriptional regulator n=1 Tax=unclassified Streptomyces TaxID=2593676 RepID=UPI0024BF33E3|nr:BTAD domain-containing putative transcriptional regulator [Streptomyces sp. ML-6]MDK0524143.1 NB-ARC domain-containing protein [Streptomyces sp. ML-6]
MFGNETPWELAEIIHQLRRSAGFTQREMAERAKISVAGLRDLEQRRVTRPRVSTLRRIAAALELSPAETHELVRVGSLGPMLAHDLRLRVLGPQSISVDGEPVNLGSERQRTMLALLAISPGVPVSLDALIDVGWGEGAVPKVDLVRSQMSRLRRRIQPRGQKEPVLVSLNGGYALQVNDGQLDLLVFRRLVASARRDCEAGRTEAAVISYRQAMGLLRDKPLVDLPAVQELPVMAGLRRELETALLEYADSAAGIGRHEEVLTPLYRFAESNPLHESVHARLMTALAGSGQPAVALELFESLRGQLAEELGVDPGELVRETHQAILRGVPARAQLVSVPPLQAGTVPSQPVPAQLPADVNGFSGRREELAHLDALGEQGEAQSAVMIVTLPGRPGVGKSSLAVHWAHRVAERFPDGQLYAELGDSCSADVVRDFLLALGVGAGQVPDSLAGRSALLRSLLTGKRVLMVLDNAVSTDQVRPLLPGSRGCVALVTSRDPLTGLVASEGARPLIVDALPEADSLTLLQRRLGAARAMAEPKAVREILALCEGLPAALVAMATRALTDPRLSLTALAKELREGYLPTTWEVDSPLRHIS